MNISSSNSPKTNTSSEKIKNNLIGEFNSIKKNYESKSITEGSTNGKFNFQ